MNTILDLLGSAAIVILVAGIGYGAKVVSKLYPQMVALIIYKIGAAKSARYLAYAKLVFNDINEKADLGTLVDSKINVFTLAMLKKFPSITSTESELLRNALSNALKVTSANLV